MRRRFTNNLSNSFDISNYMTIEALEDNVEIIMPRVVEYGIDGEGWKKYKGSVIINLGQTASFRYILPPMQNIRFGSIVINGKYKLCGNCLSLIFGDNIRYDLTGYNNCFRELFLQNKGLLSVEPHFLPAITLAPYCYTYMFYGCTALTTAPELPATRLESSCYDSMFYGCSKLKYIKMLATDISANNCLYSWVKNVASTGTFVKHPAMTSLPTATSSNNYAGIPSRWTIQNATS